MRAGASSARARRTMRRSVTDPATCDTAELPVFEPEEASVDVVVCCASARMDLVLQTFAELVADRMHPRAVPGIEADVAPLVDAITRASGPTLFVLCVGSTLGGARTRRLVELFTARRGPLHRLLVLEVDHDDARALHRSIAVGARSLRRHIASRGSTALMKRSSGATFVAGSVATTDGDLEPAVPRPRVVIADPLRDDVGPIPEPATRRSRPVLRLVPDPPADDPPADPAAETARLSRDAVVAPPAPRRVPRNGAAMLTAASVAATLLAVLSFEGSPPPRLTTGLAVLPAIDLPMPALAPATTSEPIAAVAAPESTPAPASDRQALDVAVTQGRIRELDLLLATQAYPTESTWRVAATRCRARSVNGVRGWRLPRVHELRRLSRHQVLPDGSFWTAARVPAASEPSNLTFDASTGRASSLPKSERARTVCVRLRSG